MAWEALAHYGQCHPWAGIPQFYNKAGWTSQKEQVSKKLYSMASASVLTHRFLPLLLSLMDWCRSGIKLFLPEWLLAMVFSHSNRYYQTCSDVCLEVTGQLFWSHFSSSFTRTLEFELWSLVPSCTIRNLQITMLNINGKRENSSLAPYPREKQELNIPLIINGLFEACIPSNLYPLNYLIGPQTNFCMQNLVVLLPCILVIFDIRCELSLFLKIYFFKCKIKTWYFSCIMYSDLLFTPLTCYAWLSVTCY